MNFSSVIKLATLLALSLGWSVASASDLKSDSNKYLPSYPVIYGIGSPLEVLSLAKNITVSMKSNVGSDPQKICASVHSISTSRKHLFAILDVVKDKNRQLEELWKAARAIGALSEELLNACEKRGSLNIANDNFSSYEESLHVVAALKVREMIARQSAYIESVGEESYYSELFW